MSNVRHRFGTIASGLPPSAGTVHLPLMQLFWRNQMIQPKLVRALIKRCVALVVIFSSLGIETAIAQGPQYVEENTNRPGRDYRSFDVPRPAPGTLGGTWDVCQRECQKETNRCNAWTYVKPGIQGPLARCWLKGPMPDAQPNNCCTSGVVPRPQEPGIDRAGGDYANFENQTSVTSECQHACEKDPQCLAWTSVRPGLQGPKGRCWLKNTIPPATRNTCCWSGVVERAPNVR